MTEGRIQLKCDGTLWCTGAEVKGKLANGVRSQYPSHYRGTCIQHCYRRCAHLGCQQSTELTPPADLNGLVRFAERENLVCARVPSHFKRSLLQYARSNVAMTLEKSLILYIFRATILRMVQQCLYSPGQFLRFPERWGFHISWQSGHENGNVVSPT